MIATISADIFCTGANTVKTKESGAEDGASLFSDIFEQSKPEDSKDVAAEKKEKFSHRRFRSRDKTEQNEPPGDGLENSLQHVSANLQPLGAAQDESPSRAIETITGILERNIIPSDKDIASLTETIQTSFNALTDGEKEAIMARMPQITGTPQDTSDPAAGETDTNRFYLCPLENFSEQPQDETGTELMTSKESILGDSARCAIESPNVLDAEAQEGRMEEESKDSSDLSQRAETTNVGETSEEAGLDTGIALASFQIVAAKETPTERCAATDILTRMEETLLSYDMQSDKELEIQLEPEKLGKLSIYLSMGEDGIKARISTGDSRVQSILAGGLTELINKLSENGVSVKSVDVICAEMNWQQSGERNNGGGGNGQNVFAGKGRGGACVNAALGATAGADFCSWADNGTLDSTVVYYA